MKLKDLKRYDYRRNIRTGEMEMSEEKRGNYVRYADVELLLKTLKAQFELNLKQRNITMCNDPNHHKLRGRT